MSWRCRIPDRRACGLHAPASVQSLRRGDRPVQLVRRPPLPPVPRRQTCRLVPETTAEPAARGILSRGVHRPRQLEWRGPGSPGRILPPPVSCSPRDLARGGRDLAVPRRSGRRRDGVAHLGPESLAAPPPARDRAGRSHLARWTSLAILPVQVLSRLFRGKLLAFLYNDYARGNCRQPMTLTLQAATLDATTDSPTIYGLRPSGVGLLLRRPEPPRGTTRIICPTDRAPGHSPRPARHGICGIFPTIPPWGH